MKKLLLILCVVMSMVLNIGCSPNNPETRPEIPEEYLTGSANIIKGFEEVEEAEVVVEDDKLTFYLVSINEEVPKERLRELSVFFLKALSGHTVDDGLEGATEESYGEIYDYYDVEIVVEGNRGAVLHRGTKTKGQNEIKWQE